MAALSMEIDTIIVPQFKTYEVKGNNRFESELSKIDFNESKLFELLQSNSAFADVFQRLEILNLKIDQIGEGKGFLSQVYKLVIEFTNGKTFDFIMKIPKPYAFQEFIGNWTKDADNDHIAVDQCVIDGHNAECEFYTNIHSLKGCPLPEVYVAQKYISKNEPGFLLMENLALESETLGFHRGATVDQCFAVARSIAALQYRTDTENLKEWREQKSTTYFDDLYAFHLPDSMQAIKKLPGIFELLPKLMPIMSRPFCFYSLFDRPKEFGALTLCHGDLQPNNLMFERLENGQISSKINAIIDWQIIFWGNSSFDLARFMVLCPDEEVRQQVELSAYGIYYSELQRLYEKDGKTLNFTYEQGLEVYELAMCQQIAFILMFLGIHRVMHKPNTGPLGSSFDRTLSNTIYSAKRAIQLYEKYEMHRKFS